MPEIVSRIAPTPSGYTHLGNALNFILTWKFVRKNKGKLILRIDDSDSTRTRSEYVEDIFKTLEWLGIDWDEGPRNSNEFFEKYSQSFKKDFYFKELLNLSNKYCCTCSRREIKERYGSNIYRGYCREKKHIFSTSENVYRFFVDEGMCQFENRVYNLGNLMGDFVLWTKDDTPAYQLVSLIEDEYAGITHIFRGKDLFLSSIAQSHLAIAMKYSMFQKVEFKHHDIIFSEDGEKLSKSAGSNSLKAIRESGKNVSYVYDKLAAYLE